MSLIQTANIRKSFYCFLCDYEEQLKFKSNENSLVYSEKSCKNIILTSKPFLEFAYLKLSELVNLFFEYIQCFTSSAE